MKPLLLHARKQTTKHMKRMMPHAALPFSAVRRRLLLFLRQARQPVKLLGKGGHTPTPTMPSVTLASVGNLPARMTPIETSASLGRTLTGEAIVRAMAGKRG